MILSNNPIYRTLDWLWRLVVKAGKDRCEVCGGTAFLECHHIVSRGDYWLRWEPPNGVVADRNCHERPMKIRNWLKEKDPARYQWLMEQKTKLHRGERIDLAAIEHRLRMLI